MSRKTNFGRLLWGLLQFVSSFYSPLNNMWKEQAKLKEEDEDKGEEGGGEGKREQEEVEIILCEDVLGLSL